MKIPKGTVKTPGEDPENMQIGKRKKRISKPDPRVMPMPKEKPIPIKLPVKEPAYVPMESARLAID